MERIGTTRDEELQPARGQIWFVTLTVARGMVHVQEPDSPVNYILSGMGDFCCYNADKKEEVAAEALKWSLSKENHGHIFDHDITGGFTSFQATKSALTIQYHDQKGHVLFTADPVAVREGAAK